MVTNQKESILVMASLALLLASFGFVSAITGSMGNSKMILTPEVNGWTNTVIDKTILVKNVNNISINITLKADTEGSAFINVLDKEFVLAPGEEKKAQIEIKVKKEGTYNGKVNVFFSPAYEMGNGVVLTSSITVIAAKNQNYDDSAVDEEDSSSSDNGDESSGSGITGGTINNNEFFKENKGALTLVASTIVLFLVLVILLSVLSKKGSSESKMNGEGSNSKEVVLSGGIKR